MKKILLGIFLVLCVMFIVKPVTALADTVSVTSQAELQAAIDTATSDRTIILENSISVTGSTIEIKSDNVYSFIINTNSKSLNGSGVTNTITHRGEGNVTISGGGEVAGNYNNAICNDGEGSVTISGSIVWARQGIAIYNNSTGSVLITEGSVWTSHSENTIYNNGTGSVIISGGEVSNYNSLSNAIINNGAGSVILSGGVVIANHIAINNISTGSVILSGGEVSADRSAINNLSTGSIILQSGIVTFKSYIWAINTTTLPNGFDNMQIKASVSDREGTNAQLIDMPLTVDILKSYLYLQFAPKPTDEQIVASAKAALVNGSVSVAFGADQSIKTAAVQAYVNDILSGTAEASGVTATVNYNSTTEQYDVALSKGSVNDSKSLTMTITVAPDPDIAVVNSAKSAAEGASYASMTQAAATSETVIADALKTTAEATVNNDAVTVTINKVSYTEPIAGTSANPSGTGGSYVFYITVSKGGQSENTAHITTYITPTAYTGVTDVQAVASAKTALVNGSANVAFGADQSIKTAAVQAYVNGILSGTAEASGVTATVTYNSTTKQYDVALNKGSVNDSKSLIMTITVAPDPAPTAPAGSTQTAETKTITVVEVPQSIPDEKLLTVEPVGAAFDNSVEVRLKEDTLTEGMVRTAMESVFSALNIENAQIFPLDISIYLKGTNTKVQPKEGTAVMITCPIPKEMLINMDKLVVVCVIDGELQVLPATLVTKDGVPCVQFTATHFSPYAFVIDKDNNLADYAAGTLPDVVTNISTKLTATAGTVTKVDLEGIKEGSTITYHVCTPTLISIDCNGNLFTKKAGNAILMAKVTNGGATTLYTIRVTVKYTEGGTKVGFIRYYDDIVTYNKINYRITAKATDTVEGTVAVANNQINKNLPNKVVIPATITYEGKNYQVTSIDESAFYNLNHITSVTIPAGVEEISATAFVSCDSLKSFTVSSDNKSYSAKKGMLLNKEGTSLIAYPSAKGTIVIDKKVAVIGTYAFSACKYLTGVIIPETVTGIEGCAFANSKFLSNVIFQGTTYPEIPFLCIFEKVNKACTIFVPETSLNKYQVALQDARMPKGATVEPNTK